MYTMWSCLHKQELPHQILNYKMPALARNKSKTFKCKHYSLSHIKRKESPIIFSYTQALLQHFLQLVDRNQNQLISMHIFTYKYIKIDETGRPQHSFHSKTNNLNFSIGLYSISAWYSPSFLNSTPKKWIL